MHKRKDIINNQAAFRNEIVKFLKVEFKQLKRDINSIKNKANDPEIAEGKNSLIEKVEKTNITQDIDKLFISPKNIYPNWYAWWNEEIQEVVKYKYIDNL